MHMLITGGSRGIGAAVARLAADNGWDVSLCYRRDEEAARSVADNVSARGRRVYVAQADTGVEGDVIRFFDSAITAIGPVTAVINNAGIVAPTSAVRDMTAERIERVMRINVVGAMFVAREAARRLSHGGSLVNISSVAARLGSANEFVDYAASKGAIDSLTVGLAKELAPAGVRVNAVRPGLIETGIHVDSGYPDRAKDLGSGTPLGRAGEAQEVAEAVLWLSSPQASYVTGSILDVAGGR